MIRALLLGPLATTALAPVAAAQAPDPAPRLLDDLFADHAVLQRGRPITVRGNANAGDRVSVTLGDARASARAGRDGRWKAELPARSAGGPFTLTATAGDRAERVQDVMIGDVWLCSGQSNMELQVERALDSRAVIENADDKDLRLLTVQKQSDLTPRTRFAAPVAWASVTPTTVRPFSAACYFMGQKLRETTKAPIGLINASWGGTAIDAWRSEDAVAAGGAADAVALLRQFRTNPIAANARWGAMWEKWWRTQPDGRTTPWTDAATGWTPVPALSAWEDWGVPALAAYNGLVWYRTEVTLTPEQAAQAGTLSIGWVDEIDQSWVNGVPVGNSYGPGSDRAYPLAAGTLKPGVNTITVAAVDTYARGGLVGPNDLRMLRLADGSRVPLAGPWRYYAPATGTGMPPRAPWEANAGLSGIYNGMIAPMHDYGLKGIAWYQGESDAGQAGAYAAKLTSLMADWRRQFAAPRLPFLVVQLAGWGRANVAPVESGFADIREAQRTAVAADRDAGLAVAIDIGDRTDIHPAGKRDVGLRLARAADKVAYGGTAPASGPVPLSAKRSGDTVTVRFGDVTGSLATYSARQAIGFELCGTAPSTCRFVPATTTGDDAVLSVGQGAADRVRFCWGDSPLCNLYDESGLPAGPFTIRVD